MAKLTQKHLSYLKNNDFYEQYLQLLNTRLVYSNNLIEYDNGPIGELFSPNSMVVLNDNLIAFNILMNELNSDEERPLTEELIIKVANAINKHAKYISDGYASKRENVKLDDKFPISDSKDIKSDMQQLLNNYYGKWSNLDIFEREARFNIEFLRIHPFEDGNGRTSRLLLNFNLLRNGHAPVLIPEEIREKYFYARDTENVKWIKNMFEEESEKELHAIDELIDAYESDNEYIKEI